MSISRSPRLFLALALALPVQAYADAIALTPLLKDRKVDAERVQDLFSLMSSELEFMEGVDEVIEVDVPPSLTTSCLDSTRCLGAITRDNKADTLLTGFIEEAGDRLLVDLVYYDLGDNRVVRRKTYDLSAEPAQMIDGMTPMLVETLTGVSPLKEREEAKLTDVDFDADLSTDEPDFFDDRGATIQPAPVPDEPARVTARSVDRTITAPPMPDAPAEEDEAFDPSAISFGSSADDISFGDASDEIVYEPEPEPVAPAPAPREPEPRYVREELDPYDPDVMEMEEDDLDLDRSRSDSSTRSSTRRDKKAGSDEWRRVHIQLKGGYTNFGVFNFGTVDLEAKVRLYDGLFLGVGISPHFVQRCEQLTENDRTVGRPPDTATCGADNLVVNTNTFFPINAGIVYHFKAGKFQPYLGIDGQFAQVTAIEVPATETTPGRTERYFTGGARVRAGFDVFFTRNFGLNLDAALGFWTGEGWRVVDPRNPDLGFVPHISGGVVIGF